MTARRVTTAGPSRPGFYRGVRLQKPVNPPTRPLAELEAVVREAIRKNAEALRTKDR
ncbi:hypothetical protein [Phenylobacterium soli]|uniref:hypothetical protein n=1 Tax=Phenylobacterium soli TaxID=2170551 RepID=UPI001403FE60|nr:hypothetical protein [Phenylobacterium soli]